MEHLTKLLRDSYDLQENKPEKSAYWHLQKLRSEIKQLTLNDVVKKSELLIAFAEWKEYNGKWETHKQQVKNFLKEYKSN
jgi:hypothetical protein